MDFLFSIQTTFGNEFKELAILTNGFDDEGHGKLTMGFPDSIPVTVLITRTALGNHYLNCDRLPRRSRSSDESGVKKEIRDLIKHLIIERPLVRMIHLLTKRVGELEAALYAPGGPEYEKAKASFESHKF